MGIKNNLANECNKLFAKAISTYLLAIKTPKIPS